MSSPSDAELVARARAKGVAAQAAFRALHDRYKDEVLATLTCLLRDRALAEDAHQEAFVRAFSALDRFDPARSFRAWLHQIAKNAAIDVLRLEEKQKPLAEEKERRASRDAALVPTTVERLETEERTRCTVSCDGVAPLLAARKLGALDEAEVRRVDEHVAACERCRALDADVEKALAHAKPEATSAPDALWARVESRLAAVVRPRVDRPARRAPIIALAVVAAAGVAALVARDRGASHEVAPGPAAPTSPVLRPATKETALPEPRRGVVRVIYLEGAPRWEYRYLKTVLHKDPHVLYRTWLATAEEASFNAHTEPGTRDPKVEERHPEFLKPLGAPPASIDELGSYDVVVLGDVVNDLAPAAREAIATFVERGGGLVVVAGEGLAATLGSPLERVLPVVPSATRTPPRREPFAYVRTEAGKASPILLLGEDPARTWASLPGGYWLAGVASEKPGASVLVRTPDARPVFVTGTAGEGRVFVSCEDETWRWRQEVGDRYFARFWGLVVRWAAP